MPVQQPHQAVGPDRSGADQSAPRRFGTPTGAPCPRAVRLDGEVEGSGDCHGCGACLLGTGLV